MEGLRGALTLCQHCTRWFRMRFPCSPILGNIELTSFPNVTSISPEGQAPEVSWVKNEGLGPRLASLSPALGGPRGSRSQAVAGLTADGVTRLSGNRAEGQLDPVGLNREQDRTTPSKRGQSAMCYMGRKNKSFLHDK